MKDHLNVALKLCCWATIMFFALLLVHNALLYFSFDPSYGILPEKDLNLIKGGWYLPLFYIHVFFGIICLITPVLLFWGRQIKLSHSKHRLIGNFYVWSNILVLCPTGVYLALFAKGGTLAQVGFIVQGILVALFSFYGYKSTIKSKMEHIQWMIRSYALATAVLTFRIFHILFMIWQLPYQDNYWLSQWLSMLGNGLLGELACWFIARQIAQSKNSTPQNKILINQFK